MGDFFYFCPQKKGIAESVSTIPFNIRDSILNHRHHLPNGHCDPGGP